MVNYYKPRYKKWLRNDKLIFEEKSFKFEKFKRKKWRIFKKRNNNISLQNIITFEERLRLESERGLYKKSLIQKQIFKSFYGDISEKQFKSLLLKSDLFNSKSKLSIVSLLESRLDIFIYRAKLTNTLYEARQIISHKQVKVNKVLVNSKGYILSPGDLVQIEKKGIRTNKCNGFLKNKTNGYKIKSTFKDLFFNHIQVDFKTKSAIFLEYPKVDEIFYPFNVSLKNIKEFYKI